MGLTPRSDLTAPLQARRARSQILCFRKDHSRVVGCKLRLGVTVTSWPRDVLFAKQQLKRTHEHHDHEPAEKQRPGRRTDQPRLDKKASDGETRAAAENDPSQGSLCSLTHECPSIRSEDEL